MDLSTEDVIDVDLTSDVSCQGNLRADAFDCPGAARFAVVDEHGHRIFVCCSDCRTVNERVLARLRTAWRLRLLTDLVGVPLMAVACPRDGTPCRPDRVHHESL